MGELIESNPTGEGRAHRFRQDLLGAREHSQTYETWTPLVTFSFLDGRTSAVKQLSDVVPGLFGALQATVELPHPEAISVSAVVYGREARPSEFELSFEGIDGPLSLRFGDGSALTATIERSESLLYRDRWTAGTEVGFVQQCLEEIVSLARRAQLAEAQDGDDRPITEAILTLLGQLAAAKDPPRGVVQSALHWLVPKTDAFADGAGHAGSDRARSLARLVHELKAVASG